VDSSTDRLEQVLLAGEATIARVRAAQLRVLSEIDFRQVPVGDGSRTLAEWVAARLDLAPETARSLTQTTARLADQADLAKELETGGVSFDRVVEESRLAAVGADPSVVARSRGWDIAGVRRVVARHHRMTRGNEQQIFRDRFLSIQPALDQSSYKLWGLFPGQDGHLIEHALQQRAENFPTLPNGRHAARSQRQADALVALAQDSLDGSPTDGAIGPPLVSIFVDAGLAAASNGEAGAEICSGPRIGPLTLEEILCDGQVEVLQTGPDGTPIAIGKTSRTIPPKLRRFILHRDQGACTADGCQSRYRLQPHHIIPRSRGGTHHPDNLTTLCCRLSFLRRSFRTDKVGGKTYELPPPRHSAPQRLSHRPHQSTPATTIPQTGDTRTALTYPPERATPGAPGRAHASPTTTTH